MNLKKKFLSLVILLGLLILPSSVVQAQEPTPGDVVLVGQNYTLKSGDTLNGSLVVIGGNIIIEEEAEVNGDVVLIGGNMQADGDINGNLALIGGNMELTGEVYGDVALIGGQAELKDTAVVDGSFTTVGGQLDQDPDAQINGEIVNNVPPDFDNPPEVPNIPNVPNVPNVPGTPNVNFSFEPWGGFFGIIFKALAMAGIAALLTLFLDVQIKRVGDYLVSQPLIAGSVGLLTVFISVLLILTILPVFVLLCAWVLGIVALGQEVGDRFTRAINQVWQPILSTAFGTFLLTLVSGYIGLIPCAGWLFNFVLTLAAIGAVMMTRFGTRSGAGPVTIVTTGTPAA
jgi:hypothetical protein